VTDRPASSGDDGSGWAKAILAALAALVGAVVAWGWVRPQPARPPASSPGPEPVPAQSEAPAVEVPIPVEEAVDPRKPPAWVRPTILWTLGIVVAIVLAFDLARVLGQLITYLVLALFFSFALEPAVNFMQLHWHWRRGAATGALLFVVFCLLVLIVLIFVPAVVKGASAIADRISASGPEFADWAQQHLGIDIEADSISDGAAQAAVSLAGSSHHPVTVLLGFAVSLIGGIFAMFTVAMFIFYMVADAPRFKRSILSFFSQHRQEELLSIWEAAIEKTGGYFYSRLLLATINGGLFYIVLRILGVPGAAALAFFQGTVAAFIPIIGTYIAAIVPIVSTFISNGTRDAAILLIYVLIYQQVENYLISPKIQGKTMQLHPAIAFGAALAGGALGGLLWAFLALPFAATVQASASLYVQRHEVVETEMTRVAPVAPPPTAGKLSLGTRASRWLGSTRGWIHKIGKHEEPPDPDSPNVSG
jgi:predicted PurR-regulated permease PerM